MSRKGFTLLEVLIAVMLFTIGTLIIMSLFSAALLSGVDPENTGIAMTLAQKRMEEIRNLNFDTQIIDDPKATVPGFTGFQRSVTVTTPYTDLKRVTVNIYWSYKGGETITTLVTYISKS